MLCLDGLMIMLALSGDLPEESHVKCFEARNLIFKLAYEKQLVDQHIPYYVSEIHYPTQMNHYVGNLTINAKKLINCPPVEDVKRLPTAKYIEEAIACNQNYHYFIKQKILYNVDNNKEFYKKVLEDVLDRHNTYTIMAEVYFYKRLNKHPDTRLELARLKAKLGDKIYYEGLWPLPVPLWAFQEMID